CHSTAISDWQFQFQFVVYQLAGSANDRIGTVELHGQRVGKFSAWSGADVLDRYSGKGLTTEGEYERVFCAGRCQGVFASDHQCGFAVTRLTFLQPMLTSR